MKSQEPPKIYLKDYTPPAFLIDETHLDVVLHPTETTVKARLLMRPNPAAKKKATALTLNGEHLTLKRVALDGAALSDAQYAVTPQDLTIARVPSEPFTLEIETACNPEGNKALSGLYLSRGTYCTQCEAEGFRRITYYLDRPDVLAKFRVRIEGDRKTAPVLLSNGNLIESGEAGKGRHFAVWEDPFPKPAYLFALVGGNLACVEDTFKTRSKRNVALRIYVEPGKEDRCAWAMDSLKRSMRWDEERYGLEYDLDSFMIVAVSDFNMGAMENKGLNIFNDSLILARPDTATDGEYERIESVVAHEYFHNWTGNRVTCRDWFQLCLKEGLTVFRDQEFSADMRSATMQRIEDVRFLKTNQFPEDAGPLSHPARPNSFIEINNFYTRTVYEKGAELCRMLQTMLGREGFRKGMDLYFQRHDGQAVTVEDFVSAMGDANGTDLSSFMLWYNQAGTPQLEARLTYSESAKIARLSLSQSFPHIVDGEKRKPVPIPVRVGLVGPDSSDIALKVDGKPLPQDVVVLRKSKDVITFEDVDSRPVASLLRGFSAPVALKASLNDRDLLHLVRYDSDLFNRWEAAQTLARTHLAAMANAIRDGGSAKPNSRFIAALGEVAADESLEHAYRAAFLGLPAESDITREIGADVDAEAVHIARRTLRAAIGKSLRKVLEAIHENTIPDEPYTPDAKNAGRRALRNAALDLLVAGGSRFAMAKVKEQAKSAANMTDQLAALAILAHSEDPAREAALQRFAKRWKDDHLVLDKWFALQATSPAPATLDAIAELAALPAFSMQNPNKVRALYFAFAYRNLARFHDASGRGYKIVADAVLELDGFNPQVAARLLGAFESWRLYEPKRRKHAETHLSRILKKKQGLSNDVFEIASKIAGEEKTG
jgi:aminopeptidase N